MARVMTFNPLDWPQAFAQPRHLTGASTWMQHIPFAFALVQMSRPSVIVELGVSRGDSYFAFCQAVDELKLPAQCVGIDTWQGDAHEGFYGGEVLARLRAFHDPAFGRFSTLVQSTFDAALPRFADGSIDVLHLDGFHTYEAVRHDFEAWRPKVSDRGVVLFHDTQERGRGFGVWQLWEELAGRYPSFEFRHGHGLGVLAVGARAPEPVLAFVRTAVAEPEAARRYFETLGRHVELRGLLGVMLSNVQQQQAMVNAWKQRAGIPIDPATQDPNATFGQPLLALQRLARDVHGLIADDLQFRGARDAASNPTGGPS